MLETRTPELLQFGLPAVQATELFQGTPFVLLWPITSLKTQPAAGGPAEVQLPAAVSTTRAMEGGGVYIA